MDVNKFIAEVNAINWRNFDDLEHSQPKSIPCSLMTLALADEESEEGIYKAEGMKTELLLNAAIKNNVMFAIGNGHSGEYYSVVREILPFIVQIALSSNHLVAKNCAINIIIDLYFAYPANGSEELENFVKDSIKKSITENREIFLSLVTHDKRNKSLIDSLISIVDEN